MAIAGGATVSEEIQTMADHELFERKFVETAIELAGKAKMTKKEFALKVFGYERALYALKGTTSSGRPQDLTLAQAMRMAQVIGWDFTDLAEYVRARIRVEKAKARTGQ